MRSASMRAPARVVLVVALVLAASLFSAAGAFAATGECDRACLKSTLDRYLNAVIKHDPSAAPLFVGYRQTENAAVIKPGAGVWKSVTALGKVQRRYTDPETSSAGYFGTIEEGTATDIVTLRLKITAHKISEAEWVIARQDAAGLAGGRGGMMNPDGLAATPPPTGMVAKGARSSREEMIAAANSYFDGLQAHDGSVVIAHPGCTRVENGVTVTGRGGPVPPGPPTGAGGAPVAAGSQAVGAIAVAGDCTSNFERMSMIAVAARRYPIVDEDAGVVLGMVVFIRAPGSPQKRNYLSEWMTIENGKIRGIWAAMYYPDPLIAVPNWPPYDGNWPLGLMPAPGAAGGPGGPPNGPGGPGGRGGRGQGGPGGPPQ